MLCQTYVSSFFYHLLLSFFLSFSSSGSLKGERGAKFGSEEEGDVGVKPEKLRGHDDDVNVVSQVEKISEMARRRFSGEGKRVCKENRQMDFEGGGGG